MTATTARNGNDGPTTSNSIKILLLTVTAVALAVFGVVEYQQATSAPTPYTSWFPWNHGHKSVDFVFPIKEKTAATATATATTTSSLRTPSAGTEDADDEAPDSTPTTAEELAMMVSSILMEGSSAEQDQQRRRQLAPPSSAPTPFPFRLHYADGIRYFHCPAKQQKKIDIFLLHSDSFTLRIWRSSGVLRYLCGHPRLATTAVDIDAGSDFNGLRNALNIFARQRIISLPVALVTPSASGWSVVTWMKNDPATASNYFKIWIPVAPGGLKYATDMQIINMLKPRNKPRKDINVLAIYGTGDKSGMKISERLGKLVGATVVGLPGNHSVYRQSPEQFSQTIANYLGV